MLLQSLVTAWATGTAPSRMELDAFGNPLCLASADSGGSQSDADHSGMRDCCVIGCSMSATLAAEPSGAVLFLRPASRSVAAPLAVYRPVAQAPPAYDPGNPRAPPLTV